jgi:hypothetical protein
VERGDEGLMATSLFVLDIFANDPPLALLESFLFQELIGLRETIEDESAGSVNVVFSIWADLTY